ncbi:MAG: DUF1223 domain-containing protein [Hyphomicrobiales bacterium]|nr:MAG: DUF1223 domain-containing protein [Hyphomicrobiales bacterium]
MNFGPFLSAAAAAMLLVAPVNGAEFRTNPKAVVELFTSQGCSSCPKADAMFSELGKRQDLITLAYHVDYWDYIGWPDTFGDAANSERQRAYADSWGSSRIYTPQLVVNGRKGVVGSRDAEVAGAIKEASLQLPVSLNVGGQKLEVSVAAQAGGGEATIWLITFKDHAQVEIERGENAGKTVDYTQIVTGKQMLGMWDAASGTSLKLPLAELTADGSNGAVILVQSDKNGLPGPILGAASVLL